MPIEQFFRTSMALGGNPGVSIGWRFGGATEDVLYGLGTPPAVPGATATHTPTSHLLTDAPTPFVDVTTLNRELGDIGAALSLLSLSTPTLPTLPTLPAVESFSIAAGFESTRVRWAAVGGAPVMRFSFPMRIENVVVSDQIDLYWDVEPFSIPIDVDVAPVPCGACSATGISCERIPGALAPTPSGGSPGILATGYRTSTTLGYDATETNAVYPNARLALGVNSASGGPPSGQVSFTPACPAQLASNPDALLILADQFADEIPDYLQALIGWVVDIIRAFAGSPFNYIAALAGCALGADAIEGLITGRIGETPIAAQLRPLFDLLINPPRPVTTVTPVAATLGIPGLCMPAGVCTPSILDRGVVTIGLDNSVPATGGTGGTPATSVWVTPQGAFTDALFAALSTGTMPVPADTALRDGINDIRLTVAGTTVDLTAVRDGCALGVGLGPLDGPVCGACAPGGLCAAAGSPCAFACDPITATFRVGPILPAAPLLEGSLALPPVDTDDDGRPDSSPTAPQLAGVLAAAPLFAETVRRWFRAPLPVNARYTSATGAAGRATFSYIVDPDDDCVSSESDSCPGAFDPTLADDGDGDRLGAACDGCPGVADSSLTGALDLPDRDGTPSACDCDDDNDGCNEPGFELLAPGIPVACAPSDDGIFDREPAGRVPGGDLDGDEIPDQCDNDGDDDGILTDPPPGLPADNCPLGDGDAIWEPGTAPGQDQDPDQTDSDMFFGGDLCVAPLVGLPDPIPGDPPDSFGDVFEGIAGLEECGRTIAGALFCDLQLFLECDGADYDRCWRPDAFDTVVLATTGGRTLARLDPQLAQLSGGFGSASALVPDMDGDGFPDIALAAPRSRVCPDGKNCFGAPGVVAFYASSTGKLLDRAMGATDGALYGSALATANDMLAIGAAGEASGAGAVYFFRLEGRVRQLVSTVRGTSASDGLGSYLGLAGGLDTAAPSFLVGAPGAHAGAGEIAIVDASRGVSARYRGPTAGGAMSRGLLLADGPREVLVGGLPGAFAGRGGLAFFVGGGSPRVVRGPAAGSRLGERLVALAGPSGVDVVASAPGGVGRVMRFDVRGRARGTTVGIGGVLFGTGLAAPGDLDGDGQADLVVSFGLDTAGADLRSINIYEL